MKPPATPTKHAEIGIRIRDARLKRKLRQVDLAASAGISWRHLIRMEQGEGGEPRSETLDRLASALGIERSELSGDDEDEESDPVVALVMSLRRVVRDEFKRAHA